MFLKIEFYHTAQRRVILSNMLLLKLVFCWKFTNSTYARFLSVLFFLSLHIICLDSFEHFKLHFVLINNLIRPYLLTTPKTVEIE